ncbi:MAG: septum formation initiator family protein [Clostridia bacterium]|nr:septum formation initiator family protein [Clostridia bacterium]
MSKSGKRSKSVIVRIIVLFVASYMVIGLIGLYRELNGKQQELRDLLAEKESIEIQIEDYRSRLSSASYNDIIEKAARERLGYAYPTEEIYVDISGN